MKTLITFIIILAIVLILTIIIPKIKRFLIELVNDWKL